MSAALETQVNEMLPCEQLSEYWKHGFYITSMATVGAHWAIVLSTNAGFEDQYVKVFKTAHPYKSTAIGRKGWFTYDGDSARPCMPRRVYPQRAAVPVIYMHCR